MNDSQRQKFVIVAPTFNNAGTLTEILRRIDSQAIDVIVVDDGSTDQTPAILQSWTTASQHRLITHEKNCGKADALRSAFSCAIKDGYTHAITIDTDGQLAPEEIPLLLAESKNYPQAMIVGSRDASAADYPRASRMGRSISNLLLRYESGAIVSDSQCGFRVYPLQKIEKINCRFGRYGFETEILARAAWAGIELRQVNVSCKYQLTHGRVSHFRPWRDSFSAIAMHSMLFSRSVFRRFGNWLNPLPAWRAIRHDPAARSRFAAGLASGVFIANLPIYGLQSALCLLVARKFKLHPLAVLAGSHISTPPIGPALIIAAISLGHFLVHGTLPKLSSFDPRAIGYFTLLKNVIIEWTIGGIICGIILAVTTFFLSALLMHWTMPKIPRDPRTLEDSTTHPAAPAPIRDS